jgi:hypothetical protein
VSAHLHFAENAFALHLFLQRAKRLVNVVVADEYLHVLSCRSGSKSMAIGERHIASAMASTANCGG